MDEDYGWEDPTPDYEVFERNQLQADYDAGEGRVDEEDEEYDEEDYGPGGEDSYLDSTYEDRYELGDF